MNKEQRKRMAWKGIVAQQDEGQADIEYTVQVSGNRVEIYQHYEAPWEDENGEPDSQHECWIMSKDTLKRLIEAAQWCIEKSEAFEASHSNSGECVECGRYASVRTPTGSCQGCVMQAMIDGTEGA